MLQCQHISFGYEGTHDVCLRDVSIDLPDDAIIGVAGDNGSGKSTLGLVVAGIAPDVTGGQFTGERRLHGQPIEGNTLRSHSAISFQDSRLSCLGQTILEESLFLQDTRAEFMHNIVSVLGAEIMERRLTSLSGGEQRLVSNLAALFQERKVIVLDEPFMFLDERAVECTRHCIDIYTSGGGCVLVLQGPDENGGIETSESYYLRDGQLDNFGIPPVGHNTLELDDATVQEVTCLDMKELAFRYAHEHTEALANVSLSVRRGESVAIVGPNGSGKTTLLLVLAGLLKPTRGTINVNGRHARRSLLRRSVRCCFQNPDAQVFGATVEEELSYGLMTSGVSRSDLSDRIQMISQVLPFERHRDPFSLSFGRRKLLTIAATLATNAEIVALDEPFAGLDAAAKGVVHTLVAGYLQRNGSLIITGCQRGHVAQLCHRVVDIPTFKQGG